MQDLSASIVTYKNSASMLAQTVHSFLKGTTDSKLFILDNSPTDDLKYLAYNSRIQYIFNNKNVGFGAGHNIILNKILNESKYHIVLNPDVYFDENVISKLLTTTKNSIKKAWNIPKISGVRSPAIFTGERNGIKCSSGIF